MGIVGVWFEFIYHIDELGPDDEGHMGILCNVDILWFCNEVLSAKYALVTHIYKQREILRSIE